ncbi:hypothetical protein GBA52_008717 [Prunus armeniaca]|nr:hypothetical protein GBA52_008717 [Prunus armeniaca]
MINKIKACKPQVLRLITPPIQPSNKKFSDLHQRCQSPLHAHNTIHGVDKNISKSKKAPTALKRRMNKNKWIVGSCNHAYPLSY